MRAGSRDGDSSNDDGDFELNLAPIIDCFTVLITYLLVSTSFISLEMLDVQINSTNTATTDEPVPKEEPTHLAISLQTDHNLELRITGPKPDKIIIQATQDNRWNTDELLLNIKHAREKHDNIKEVSIQAHPTVKYKEVVGVIEAIKRVSPQVVLGS